MNRTLIGKKDLTEEIGGKCHVLYYRARGVIERQQYDTAEQAMWATAFLAMDPPIKAEVLKYEIGPRHRSSHTVAFVPGI